MSTVLLTDASTGEITLQRRIHGTGHEERRKRTSVVIMRLMDRLIAILRQAKLINSV
jgi:hypothetical protein